MNGRPSRFRARLLVGLAFAAFAALILAVNHWEWRDGHLRVEDSAAVMGDEPHYLLVISSLLIDGDVDVAQDYARVGRGGLEAGRNARGHVLDHHSILVDRQAGLSKRWKEVFDSHLAPCGRPNCLEFKRRTTDFPFGAPQEVSAHPITYPALTALLLLPFRLPLAEVERGASFAMQLFAFLGLWVTYLAGRAAGFGRGRALLAAALLLLASPWLAYSRSFFSDLPAGLFLVLALWGDRRGSKWLVGVGAGLALACKPSLGVFGLAWLLAELFARRWRSAISLGVPLALIGSAQAAVNWFIARTLVISGSSAFTLAHGLDGLFRTLFESGHGLIPFVPWVLIPFASIAAALVRRDGPPSCARAIALPVLLFLCVLAASAHVGEVCYGPRYWISVLPLFAVAALEPVEDARTRNALLGVLALVAAYAAIPGALRYRQIWDQPPGAAWPAHRT